MTNAGVIGFPARAASVTSRADIAVAARGFVTEPYPLVTATNSTALATQTLYAQLVGLKAGDRITSIVVAVSSVASLSITLAKVAVYSAAGTMLASSGDLSASLFSTTGLRSGLLSAPYTAPFDGGYYLALLVVGTTPPTLFRGMAQAVGALGSNPAASGTQASQSDLPASLSITQTSSIWTAAA